MGNLINGGFIKEEEEKHCDCCDLAQRKVRNCDCDGVAFTNSMEVVLVF